MVSATKNPYTHSLTSLAIPESVEKIRMKPIAVNKVSRRPATSTRRPLIGAMTVCESRYDVPTQEYCLADPGSSAAMVGKETDRICPGQLDRGATAVLTVLSMDDTKTTRLMLNQLPSALYRTLSMAISERPCHLSRLPQRVSIEPLHFPFP